MSQFNSKEYYEDNRFAQNVALLIVCLGSFLNPLILSSVLVAIPSIADDLRADAVLVGWIPTSFLLTTVVLMLPFGKLSDMYGRKRVYLIGVIVVSVASFLASQSPNIEWLLVCRVLQGIGAAQTVGSGMAIISAVYPKEKRGAALGFIATAVYIGLTSGPLLGGLLTDWFGWRSVFLFHVPLSAIVAVLTLWKLKGEWKLDIRPRFDWVGSLIFASAAILVLLGLSSMPSWPGALMLVASVGCCYAFNKHQSHIPDPLVNMPALKLNRIFSFSLIAAFLLYTAIFPTAFLLSLYLQYIKGISPTLAGQFLITQAVIMAILAPITGRLSDRYEPRLLTSFGALLVAAGFAMLLRINYETPNYFVVVSQVLLGIGIGCFTTPNNNAALGSLKKAGLGIASAMLNLARTLGNMIGMGLATMIIAIMVGNQLIEPDNYNQLLTAIKISFGLSFCFAIVAAFYSYVRGKVHEKEIE